MSFAAADPGGWDPMFRAARLLDQAGFDRLVVSDHVVLGERLDEYGRPEIGGRQGGRQPTGPDGHWLEPLTTLSVPAGMTPRIRLGTNILIAALREAGRDPSGLQVVGRPPVHHHTDGTLDIPSTMAEVPPLPAPPGSPTCDSPSACRKTTRRRSTTCPPSPRTSAPRCRTTPNRARGAPAGAAERRPRRI
ncbi:hypothetical protein GCM10023195_69370 [Actinoallomurus liliacearum]|uniref:Luciferase-like domain-containing protein n=1 Tax=Actinoallomurus liliacearum TaxID=1080073 RepID=A0ABP8TUW8_9ACTN